MASDRLTLAWILLVATLLTFAAISARTQVAPAQAESELPDALEARTADSMVASGKPYNVSEKQTHSVECMNWCDVVPSCISREEAVMRAKCSTPETIEWLSETAVRTRACHVLEGAMEMYGFRDRDEEVWVVAFRSDSVIQTGEFFYYTDDAGVDSSGNTEAAYSIVECETGEVFVRGIFPEHGRWKFNDVKALATGPCPELESD